MFGIYNGSSFENWLMDIHEKVEVGVHVFPHVAVEEVDFCLVCFFSVFFQ